MGTTSSSSSAASTFVQANRQFRFETALGKEALVVAAFSIDEAMSQPYRIDVELVSTDPNVDAAKLLRQPATLTLGLLGGGDRVFHGLVSRFVQLGRTDGLTSYRAEVVPWLWFLKLTRDCRIFQNLSVPEIVEKVFKDAGASDFALRLIGAFPKREYCVQYRESDFDFVSRLLEDEGIFYFFEHAKDKHVLVLGNATSAVKACPGLSKAVRMNTTLGDGYEQNVVTEFAREHSVHVGKVALRDFNYLTPSSKLEAQLAGEEKGEAYDYPGGFAEHGEGDRYARLRLEAEEAMRLTTQGASNVRQLQAGGKFDLSEHYRKDANGTYQLLRVHHAGRAGSLALGQPDEYQNAFVAIPIATVYRPPRTAPRPRVHGTQTAIVVGKSGEEIWVDKYGRVKVQFHWDREGRKDENSSCWVRVSSTWAGKQWGFIQIPRIGQEVIVDFLEGDPDQPLVVGSVYNGDNMPPWALPANQTQSGVTSRSTKGGSAANANTIRFEDKKGSEQVTIHAEKDMQTTVEHDDTLDVGNNQTISIGSNRTESVGANEQVSIGKNRTEDVSKNESITIGENRTRSVGKSETITIGENRQESVGKDEKIEIGASRNHTVGKDDVLDVGKKLTITAGDQITLTVGDASLVMKKDGTITIKGKDIGIDGSGKINVKASSDIVLKGSQIKQN